MLVPVCPFTSWHSLKLVVNITILIYFSNIVINFNLIHMKVNGLLSFFNIYFDKYPIIPYNSTLLSLIWRRLTCKLLLKFLARSSRPSSRPA